MVRLDMEDMEDMDQRTAQQADMDPVTVDTAEEWADTEA